MVPVPLEAEPRPTDVLSHPPLAILSTNSEHTRFSVAASVNIATSMVAAASSQQLIDYDRGRGGGTT
eukprot:2566515-Pyramimonas_sp.AAC.1